MFDKSAPLPFKRLLVPLDGAEVAPRAIDAGIALAHQNGAAITAFIVEAPVPVPSGSTGSVEEYRSEERAQRVLRSCEEHAQTAGVPFEGHYRCTADVTDAIVSAAQEYRCDMIVMVTHRRGVGGRTLFGSHAQQVIVRSTLPVLVMH